MTSPEHGQPTQHGDGIRRLIAANPGPMTHWGTNTWLLGEREVAVIDPGPDLPDHLEAILKATEGQTISHILVTHAHADHSSLSAGLSARTGAPVYGFGPPTAGRSAIMEKLASQGQIRGGEGMDDAFKPDHVIAEGDRIAGEGWTLDVLHTPGHFAGHLSYQMGRTLFSGDHVMDWSSSLVSPPDGDLGDFNRTSARLRDLGLSICHTGHGADIPEPEGRLSWLILHRQKREEAILDALDLGMTSIPDLTSHVYGDVPLYLHKAASRNVLAHLVDLTERRVVEALPEIALGARFQRL